MTQTLCVKTTSIQDLRQGCTSNVGTVIRETTFCTAVSKIFSIIISVFFLTHKNVY